MARSKNQLHLTERLLEGNKGGQQGVRQHFLTNSGLKPPAWPGSPALHRRMHPHRARSRGQPRPRTPSYPVSRWRICARTARHTASSSSSLAEPGLAGTGGIGELEVSSLELKGITFLSVLLLLAAPIRAAGPPVPFPLLGRWRPVEEMGPDGRWHAIEHYMDAYGRFHNPSYELKLSHEIRYLNETQFGPNGSLNVIFSGMPLDGNAYTFEPPDIYVIHWCYGDSFHPQRVRFHLDGDLVTLIYGSLDSLNDPNSGAERIEKMRRIHDTTETTNLKATAP